MQRHVNLLREELRFWISEFLIPGPQHNSYDLLCIRKPHFLQNHQLLGRKITK
jgi:hypothetical protein